jgi:hypothetical protein
MTFKQRLKAAFRTNEPQALTVMTLTAINLTIVASHVEPPPLAAWVVSLLFWPAVKLVVNFLDPIPEQGE